jgi:hypothetical protein
MEEERPCDTVRNSLCRLAEIQEVLPKENPNITLKHVASQHNIADLSTRLCFKHPSEIPWFSGDLKVDERLHTSPVGQNVANLPDVKKQEVTVQNGACGDVLNDYPVMTIKNLVMVKLHLEPNMPEERQKHKAFKMSIMF